jgi:hypothetical protein
MYGLLGTAKLNGHNPEAFLREVLARIADHPISRINELLPGICRRRTPLRSPANDATPKLPPEPSSALSTIARSPQDPHQRAAGLASACDAHHFAHRQRRDAQTPAKGIVSSPHDRLFARLASTSCRPRICMRRTLLRSPATMRRPKFPNRHKSALSTMPCSPSRRPLGGRLRFNRGNDHR